MSDGLRRREPSSSGAADSARMRVRARADAALRVVQGLLALWLLTSPALLAGPSLLVGLKDASTGGVLLTVTVAATVSPAVRRAENAVCAALGGLLVIASVLLEFGAGPEAVARQWSQVVVGVLLLCLGAIRAR